MAEQGVQLHQERFCCSICLDLLKDPVTVPCGHNYCSKCIEGYWDQDNQRGRFNCPQCRKMFTPRPVLMKNTMLADMMDVLKKTGLQDVPRDSCYAGAGDVACDFCTGSKLKAVKTCLQCLVSYCDTHLQPHYQSPAFKNHKLVKTSSKVQENICSLHDEVKKVFCRTDQQCICYLCCMEEHKGHDTISVAAERTERQKTFATHQQNIQQQIQEREKDVKVLHQEVGSINHSADTAVKDSDTIFTDLISSIKRRQSEVRRLIRDQQKREVSRVEELRKVVEQEVTELRISLAELEKISHTEDDIHFVNSPTSLSKTGEPPYPISSNVHHLRYFEDVTVVVSKMKDKIEAMLKEEETNVSGTVNRVDVLYSRLPEHRTRAEFLQYSCPITLDANTVNKELALSQGNRKVQHSQQNKYYSYHSDRFTHWQQVLSTEGLTGCWYGEVLLSGSNVNVHTIAFSYKDIGRIGGKEDSGFGYNDKSWSLDVSNYQQCRVFRHRNKQTEIPGPVSSRVGVYLDHSAGTLSFYSVSDTMTLLHRVQTTFTQPLYFGFGLYSGAAELCDL